MLLLVFIKDHTSLSVITALEVFIALTATHFAGHISSLALQINDEQLIYLSLPQDTLNDQKFVVKLTALLSMSVSERRDLP